MAVVANNRVFYANHSVAIGGTTVQGAQSVSVNTNYNLEQVFQLGRLAIYDNVTLDPEVEVTINKALDGHSTIWVLATGGGTIVSNANDQSTIKLGVGNDTADAVVGADTTGRTVQMTGCYVSSLNYTFPVDGLFTEEVTFIGTNKTLTSTVSAPASGDPATINQAILRRQNFNIGSSTLPAYVQNKRLSQVTISADLGREAMYQLGEFAPFHRFVNFPLEITTTFDVIADSVDQAVADLSTVGNCDTPDLQDEEPIVIQLCEQGGGIIYSFNLGCKNRLQSVSYSGGDTGGGNVTITYTYVTYNDLSIRDGSADSATDFPDC